MNTEFTLTQKRALAILTLIALLFGAYFLRNYFVLIVVAAVGAYLFTPLFKWFTKRFNTGLSAACTLLSALAAVVVPVGALVGLAIVGVITSAIIFVYVFVALLVNREKLRTLIGQLNPLGEDVTDLYLQKMGSMVRGTVNGQFVIAACQGVAGAASIYIAGFHHGFFIFAIVLTALSIIPLGGGIVTIPFGIGMIFYGNIAGGIFVLLWHLLVVTNIDNVLRPILVPRDARLNSALMLLSVFAGITMFGPWGIIIGPVLMILIVTTIDVYLAVYKGVELEQFEAPPVRRRWLPRRGPATSRNAPPPSTAE